MNRNSQFATNFEMQLCPFRLFHDVMIMFCVPTNVTERTRPVMSQEFAAFLRHWEVLSPDLRD
jgi:hypothetical protein